MLSHAIVTCHFTCRHTPLSQGSYPAICVRVHCVIQHVSMPLGLGQFHCWQLLDTPRRVLLGSNNSGGQHLKVI